MRADPRRCDCRHLAFILLVLTASLGTAGAATVNLGDLNVPQSRVPDFYAFDETVYNQARSWPEYDVTCSSAPCASGRLPFTDDPGLDGTCDAVSTSDFSEADCMANNVSDNSVLFFPAGTYSVMKKEAVSVGRSNVVLRGEGLNTIWRRDAPGRESVGDDCGSNEGGIFFSACHPDFNGPSTSWTSGYAQGTSVVTLANVSNFPVGSWILLRMDGDLSCSLADRPLGSGPSVADAFVHIAKVTNVSGNSVTIDRRLRFDYSAPGCTGHEAAVFNPVENVGLEKIRFTTNTGIPRCGDGYTCIKYTPITFAGSANSWLVDSQVDRASEMWVKIKYAARIWIQGNRFENLDETIEYNTEGMYMQQGAVDNVWENNYCTGTRVCQKIDNGAEGNVTAYNYFRQNQNLCERAYFNHGHFSRANLTEGNDMDCRLELADSYWGRNGPGITAYRNRNVTTGCTSRGNNTVTMEEVGQGNFPAADFVNVIGNTSGEFVATPVQNNPSCPPSVNNSNDLSTISDDIWLEKNAWRLPGGAFDHGSANNRSCGTAPGDGCPGTNHNTDKPHASWSGVYPTSLYRTEAPSWWCQEACPWSQEGIGAFGDDFSATLCKLPAQIRVEGGTCTPLSIGVPAAPILLP